MIYYDTDSNTYISSLLESVRVTAGFTTSTIGDARENMVIKNYLQEETIRYDHIVRPQQIHSTNIEVYNEDLNQVVELEDTDGVVTKTDNTVLTVITADCVPIIYAGQSAIGISHQGWRGLLKRLPQKMVVKVHELGDSPKTMTVAIGPSIGVCCYNITQERYEAFMEEFDEYESRILQHRGGKWYLDSMQLAYLLLTEVGVKPQNIDFFPFCTSCNNDQFFSSRRLGPHNLPEQFSFIVKQ